MSQQEKTLFANGTFADVSRRSFDPGGYVDRMINSISTEQLLTLSEADITEHLFDRIRLDPIITFNDKRRVEHFEHHARVRSDWDNVQGTITNQFSPAADRYRLLIPFTGDYFLWSFRPDNYISRAPEGEVKECSDHKSGHLILNFTFTEEELQEDLVLARVNKELEIIDFYVDSLTVDVNRHNTELLNYLKRSIHQRKNRALRARGIASKLGIPLKRNLGAPSIEPIRMERRSVVSLPSAPDEPFEPEPGIENEHYEHILNVLRHGLRTFEESPKTCSKLNEEDLRNLLLANLNGHYERDASGETFRKTGRTDIRIVARDRAAFVAECKVWRGPSGFRSTIDQLLSYLTWRDSKAAIIILNKHNRRFINICSKIDRELPKHRLSKRRTDGRQREGEWRLVFRSREDERKEITLHVLAANLYVPDST